MSPLQLLNTCKSLLEENKLKNLEPLLGIFQIAGNQLNLVGREPMIPLFTLKRPKRMTVMSGRQISKSYTLAELLILFTGLSKGFKTAIVEPRFSQKKNFNRQILTPLLRDCAVQDMLIDKAQVPVLDAKVFKSGGDITLISGLTSGDSSRGTSGISMLKLDECASADTELLTKDFIAQKYKKIKISEISKGMSLISFVDGAVLESLAANDSKSRGIRSCYRILTSTGKEIVCTEGHLLPTNKGKLRLGEIVDCIYDEQENPPSLYRTWVVGASSECCDDCTGRGVESPPYALDNPAAEAVHVQFPRSKAIIRARTQKTIEERELNLQLLLRCIIPENFKNISLVIVDSFSDSSEIGIKKDLITPSPAVFKYDPIVSIEYVGEKEVYDLEVEATHNYILANGICSYNCQDLLPSNVPVFESMTDAMVDTGFRMYTGTAKTSDGTLAMKFDESSQGHWCIKCSCGKYNIAALEEQLIKMIGKHGCSCAYCGKLLDVTSGYYVHKYPSRIYTHVGYHMPQIIFGFHNTPTAWTELLYKMEHNSRTLFYNEALGVPDDDSVRMLTKEDLVKARNNIKTKAEAVDIIYDYHHRILGVDWGGGGGGDSATGVAVICKNNMTNHFECIYMARLQQGLSPEQEAIIVNRLAKEFQVAVIAHDYTGAGFVREALFLNKYPEWANNMFPVSYSYRPTSDLVTFSNSGSRGSYVVDKTKSLLLTINAIKYNALFIPWFDPKDPTAPQLDFLSIIEHEQRLTDAEKNEVQRASNIFLLDKVAGKKDDAAQAVNIALIAMCHMVGQYPVFTFDDKFNLTEDQYNLLVEDTNGRKKA